MFAQRRLLAFVVLVLVMILVLAPAWFFLAPGYTDLLAGAGNALAPSGITMRAVGNSIVVQSAEQSTPITIASLAFQAGLFLVLILVLATPGLGVRRRLAYVAAAAALTFGLHVVGVLTMGIRTRALRPVIVLVGSVGIDAVPILIWGILCARYWWPALKGQEAAQSEQPE